jgi:hypothetical protein
MNEHRQRLRERNRELYQANQRLSLVAKAVTELQSVFNPGLTPRHRTRHVKQALDLCRRATEQ